MLKTALKLFGVVAAVLLLIAVSLTWVVVRVVPAPALLARVALAFTPAAGQRLDLPPELFQYREPALAAVRELRAAGDAELVRVASTTETVSVTKQGDRLAIEVLDGADVVKVNVPLAAVERFLSSWDGGDIRPAQLLPLLREFNSGKAVEVRNRDASVDMWVW